MKVIRQLIEYFEGRGELSPDQQAFLVREGFWDLASRYGEDAYWEDEGLGFPGWPVPYEALTHEQKLELLEHWWDHVIALDAVKHRDRTSKEKPRGKYVRKSKRQKHMGDRIRQMRGGSSE